ncbi:ABC transporter substrate-binding protein [Pseudomonas sp. ABC1]|uniref:DUF5983 family protein n=1 Tax=Pseudomonas sp. ABC1 TaxID=2748080 RepID=UPI0015C3A5DA|nr:ABC transporter substrate-binding protein [Pseudomonas sp. ABC1]QLF92070.1 ABC transporter substrate-binding protein [Pseudomonas sp. ABC1]
MSQHSNPFIRGYWNLRIIRTLSISYEDGSPHVWRPLHPNQQHLRDEELLSSFCIVTNDFALIRNGNESISAELQAECDAVAGTNGDGIAGAVVYAIHGNDFDGRPIHIGDTYSSEAAREALQRLNFETGYYSRCWEISSAHLSERSWHYLSSLASREASENLLFVAFPIPESPAIGLKLISTPWTDHNLEHVMGIDAQQIRQEHKDKGIPDDLANILELAGQADVRILIFDGDAPALLGLPLMQSEY